MFSGPGSRVSASMGNASRQSRSASREPSPPRSARRCSTSSASCRLWTGWPSRWPEKHGLPVSVEAPRELRVEEESLRSAALRRAPRAPAQRRQACGAKRAQRHCSPSTRGTIRIEVRDDGVGFDPSAPHPGESFGLFSIGERVRSLGGTMQIESTRTRGTRIQLDVPRSGERPSERHQMKPDTIRILLVDDHQLFLDGSASDPLGRRGPGRSLGEALDGERAVADWRRSCGPTSS